MTDNGTAINHVLLIGADGMLGRAWQVALDEAGIAYTCPDRESLDLTRAVTIENTVSGTCDVAINCAAWTDVDGAESDERAATAVNGEGVGVLARQCAANDVTLVHYSTDYVFDGKANTPYAVDHPRDPVNAYGRSKAEGERHIEQSGVDHLLIRTSWLYAPWGKNFVTTMARLTRERETLDVVDDQHGRPTSAMHLSRTSLALLHRQARGLWHVTDSGTCTWFDLACFIRDRIDADCRIEPCTSEQFPRPAPRPGYSVLDLDKTESLLGPMTPWREQVQHTLDQMKARL